MNLNKLSRKLIVTTILRTSAEFYEFYEFYEL